MMETTSLSNDNNEALGINTSFINNSYLKSSNSYLSTTETPTTNNANAFSRPRVIQWDPHMGTDQSTITVVLEQAVSDSSTATPTEIHPMKLVFGSLVVETNQQQQRAPTASPSSTLNSQLVWITLVARVPRLADTQVQHGNQVPLSVCVYDHINSDTATDHWDFGVFTYNTKSGVALKQETPATSPAPPLSAAGGPADLIQGKKRGAPTPISASNPLEGYNAPNNKRQNTNSTTTTIEEDQQLFNQLLAPFDDSPTKTLDSSDSLTHERSSRSIAPHPSYHHHSNAFIQPNLYSNSGSSGTMHDYYHPINIQPSPVHQLGYNSSAFNNTYNSYNSSIYPNYALSQQSIYHAQPTQSSMMTPSLQSNTTKAAADGEHPFAGVLGKANLKILGDMAEMTWNWSHEEWSNGRRLVQFWRKQHAAGETNQQKDNLVECGFEAIEQETYQQQRIRENLAAQKDAAAAASVKKTPPLVISCIYWKERNDYYITSVDCIYLLEGLIGVQFTVEEKNRIRRNLEGFRPLTVSKCKPECADFFRLIMSFPHPKPRNIEKDVKVFAWKSLPSALTKIIRKYTPSYSSTVVA
ncbi:hypothetical protein [Parasitella parasitica]|uniref:DUF7082 domain-containing protein n=1 Tax=Parasitella parasitica TaxID=35722 RepID=A0A0B7NHS7_9FUNG|nr:hypothetical protein [Parasitella parasitica]